MHTETVKVFQSGNSQAVRLPKKFRFKSNKVFIHREGNKIILTEKPTSWEGFSEGFNGGFSEDFSVDGALPNDTKRKEFE